nr:retrovirus-related Pol polyprotein from transposon TNT 1-94 [Tanacetum cinerariifolium]
MSLAKAEYVADAGCCANILWMKSQLTDYDIIYEKVPIFCDNTSAIAISSNPVLYSRTKHIEIRYHFIRDHVLKGDIELHFIPTQYHLADIFTKPLDESTFKRLIVKLEEPVTLDKPESPNTFLPVSQVDSTFDAITFTTNNEVALLYPSHPNQDYFEAVLDFISKCYLKEPFTRASNQYKEYMREVWYTTKTLDNSKVVKHMANGVKVDYAKIIWEDLIHKLNKKNREKIVPYPRFLSLLLEHMILEYENEELTINLTQVFNVHNLTLKPNQPEEPHFTDHIKAICNLDVLVDSKAPKSSSQTKEVPQGKKPRAKRSNPNVLVDKTKSARDRLKTAHTDSGENEESKADDISRKLKLKDLSDILKDIASAFFTPDSPPDEPIIVSDESEEEEEVARDKDTKATSHDVPKDTSVPSPLYLKSAQIQELIAQAHLLQAQKEELEQAKAKVEA